MSLFNDHLAQLEAKHDRQMAGLMAAHGLMAEADALCEMIGAHCQPGIEPVPVACVHDDGKVEVEIYVFHHHQAVRQALRLAGLTIADELAIEPNPFQPKKSRSCVSLSGFDVRLTFEGEVEFYQLFPEAA